MVSGQHTSDSLQIEQAIYMHIYTRIHTYLCTYTHTHTHVITTNEERSYGFGRARKGVWEGWREERKYKVTRDVKIYCDAINAYK